MNIYNKFQKYYACHICKCIEHAPNTFFINNLNCPILNTTIELVYRTTISKCSNYMRNMIISNCWLYCGDYVGQRHCWIQQYRFCLVTSEDYICTWTVDDLTIDINVRTNWLWTLLAISVFSLNLIWCNYAKSMVIIGLYIYNQSQVHGSRDLESRCVTVLS